MSPTTSPAVTAEMIEELNGFLKFLDMAAGERRGSTIDPKRAAVRAQQVRDAISALQSLKEAEERAEKAEARANAAGNAAVDDGLDILESCVREIAEAQQRAEAAESAARDARAMALEEGAQVVENAGLIIPMWERPGSPPGNGPARRATQAELAAAIRSLASVEPKKEAE